MPGASKGALDGLLVVTVEQAVAAPYCSARLADAGARVIKIERPEGDFARGYTRGYINTVVSGEKGMAVGDEIAVRITRASCDRLEGIGTDGTDPR